MELTIDEIKTYLHCPAQYRFKHMMNLGKDSSESIAYSKALHKTVQYMYYSAMGGFIPTAKQMKDKWSKVWNEEQEIHFDFTRDFLTEHVAENTGRKRSHEQAMKKRTVKGYQMIHNFHHYNKDTLGVPIAVDHEFRVPIGDNVIIGNFELIREYVDTDGNNRFIDIVDFKTGTDNRGDFLKNNDLVMTIMSYAFRKIFESEEDRLVFSYIGSGKETYTERNDNDYRRMQYIVESVAKGIEREDFHPRETFMCQQCPFKEECDATTF